MWLVMSRQDVEGCQSIIDAGGGSGNGGWQPATVASSNGTVVTPAVQYCRAFCCTEDPWISVLDHPAHIVYGEHSYGKRSNASINFLCSCHTVQVLDSRMHVYFQADTILTTR